MAIPDLQAASTSTIPLTTIVMIPRFDPCGAALSLRKIFQENRAFQESNFCSASR